MTDQEELVEKIGALLERAKSGDIVSFIGCGTHSNGDIYSLGMVPVGVNLSALMQAASDMLSEIIPKEIDAAKH